MDKDTLDYLKVLNEKTNETIMKIVQEHFKQLQKQDDKHMSLIEKNTQKFLDKIGDIIDSQKATQVKEAFTPVPLDTQNTVNTIEKEEPEEINLEDTNRIPIVEGVKIKFEDEESVFPIDIQSSEQSGL